MKDIDYRTFRQLLHIEEDDFWVTAPGFQGQFSYRIAGGAVRAVPWGLKVDESSQDPIRPLIRDKNYHLLVFESLDGERDELEVWNPSGEPDAVLFELPAPVAVVVDFLNQAKLWWMVDKAIWQECGLPEINAELVTENAVDCPFSGQELSAPAQQEPATPNEGLMGKPEVSQYFTQTGLRTALAPFMKEPQKLEGLFSNATRNGLNSCKREDGWDLKQVTLWLLKKGYLNPDITERRVAEWLESNIRV